MTLCQDGLQKNRMGVRNYCVKTLSRETTKIQRLCLHYWKAQQGPPSIAFITKHTKPLCENSFKGDYNKTGNGFKIL